VADRQRSRRAGALRAAAEPERSVASWLLTLRIMQP
jgi:hypothetical protein